MTEITTAQEFDRQIQKLLKKTTLTFSRKKKLLLVSDMAELTAQAYRKELIKEEEMDEWFTKIFSKYGCKREDFVK